MRLAETIGVAREDCGMGQRGAGQIGQRAAGEMGQRVAGEIGQGAEIGQSGHMAHGAKALPPQQRRRSRLNRRVASPRLAARALTPLVSARPNGIITRRSRREEREAVVPLRRRGSQQQRRLQALPRARAQVVASLRRMHQEARPSRSTGLGLAGLLSARAGIATSTILIATRSMA